MTLDPADIMQFPAFAPGEVWLAGAGPGDPHLLTLLALHALRHAEDIVHDALVDPRVLRLAGPEAKLHFVGKRGGKASPRQADINTLIVELARAGRRVLRLKGGDPFVFGRGMEEVDALNEAGLRYRLVPGITAGLGGLAISGIPATTRDTNYAVILASGHRAPDATEAQDWAALARTGQPIVLYMAMANLAGIVAALRDAGMAPHTPVAIVASATTTRQQVIDTTLGQVLADVDRCGAGAPSIVVIGVTAGLRHKLCKGMIG